MRCSSTVYGLVGRITDHGEPHSGMPTLPSSCACCRARELCPGFELVRLIGSRGLVAALVNCRLRVRPDIVARTRPRHARRHVSCSHTSGRRSIVCGHRHGAWTNLIGETLARSLARRALDDGHRPGQEKLPTPLRIQGVGNGHQHTELQIVPHRSPDRFRRSRLAPVPRS